MDDETPLKLRDKPQDTTLLKNKLIYMCTI